MLQQQLRQFQTRFTISRIRADRRRQQYLGSLFITAVFRLAGLRGQLAGFVRAFNRRIPHGQSTR